MEFCERDYTQMRIIPSDRDSSLSFCLPFSHMIRTEKAERG